MYMYIQKSLFLSLSIFLHTYIFFKHVVFPRRHEMSFILLQRKKHREQPVPLFVLRDYAHENSHINVWKMTFPFEHGPLFWEDEFVRFRGDDLWRNLPYVIHRSEGSSFAGIFCTGFIPRGRWAWDMEGGCWHLLGSFVDFVCDLISLGQWRLVGDMGW